MRLRRRTSTRSRPSSRAMRSIRRSIASTAAGRRAPRGWAALLWDGGGPREWMGRHHMRAGNTLRRDIRHDDAPRHEGAGVVQQRAAHAENLAIAVDRDRDVVVLVALLRRRKEMLAAVLEPFDRPRQLERRRGDHALLRRRRWLAAEA